MVYNITSNMTGLLNANNTIDLVKFANESSGNVLMNFFIPAIFIIVLITLLRAVEFKEAFAVSSFFTMLVSVVLGAAGLVGGIWLFSWVIITAVAMFFLYRQEG